MINQALFTSNSDEWSTPQDFFNKLNEKYHFSFDLACNNSNCKTENGYKIEECDSLKQEWEMLEGWLWLNPPYSNIKEWVKKAYLAFLEGAKIVMLIPSRTDTKYFHDYIYKKENIEIEFVKGRLKFGDSKNSAPFPSMIVIFNGK